MVPRFPSLGEATACSIRALPAWQAFEREGKGSVGKKSFNRERNARGARERREGNACQSNYFSNNLNRFMLDFM